jgi:short-subunit dehydrogenase
VKRILIVGGTSGIGLALAERLAEKQWQVAVSGRRVERLEALRRRFPDTVKSLVCDITDLEAARKHIHDAAALFGALDVVVVNAGVGNRNIKHEWEPDAAVFATNICGFAACAHEALAIFRQQGFGHLVGVSSVAGHLALARSAAYTASKAFVSNYLRGLRMRASRWSKNIYVSDVRPGFIETEMTAGLKGMFWVISAEKSAIYMEKLLHNRRKTLYMPYRWRYLSLFIRLIPDYFLRLIP